MKLKENDIRPENLMQKQKILTLTDAGRMLSRCGEFVHVDCPACGTTPAVEKFKKNGISYVECENCQTFYVNPRPSEEILEWFYKGSPNYAYWNEIIFPASETARLERIFTPRVDRVLEMCEKYGVSTNSLMEIGAGFGTFCGELKRRNIFSRVVAVEPTPDLAATCRGRGVEVIESPVERIQLREDELFDVVVSFEVIEHLFNPKAFVANMARLLKPGGIILLVCPNGKGFDVETLGVLSNTVDHEHLNYFNPQSLGGLLERSGLKVLEQSTPGKLDVELVRNKVLDGEFDVGDQPFLKRVLVDSW
jgi:2-polyprenyl-3-methyl-5-hydroxy-6-metoxy-1,4-benzoquinol methylase/predicted RNA-binding Zn-ribbon protein involved in translation (DUF1610 family)